MKIGNEDHKEGCIDIQLIVSFPPHSELPTSSWWGIQSVLSTLWTRTRCVLLWLAIWARTFPSGPRQKGNYRSVGHISARVCLFFGEQIQPVLIGFFHLFLAHPDIGLFAFHLVKDEAKWMKSLMRRVGMNISNHLGGSGEHDVGGFSPVWVVAGVANLRQWDVFHTYSSSSTVVPPEQLLGWIKLHCNRSSWQESQLIQWPCHTQGYSWAHRIAFCRISFWLGKSFRNRLVTSIGHIFRVCGHFLYRPSRQTFS